jgi:hypothetical protein
MAGEIFNSRQVEHMMQKAAMGTEPKAAEIDAAKPDYTTSIMRAFNWYNYEKDMKVARSYIRAWVKARQPADVKRFDAVVDELTAPVFGWLARLDLNGARLSDEHKARLEQKVADLMGQYRIAKPIVEAEPDPNRKSIQQVMAEKQAEFLGEFFEGALDDFILNDCRATDFDLYKHMQAQNTAKQYAAAVVSLCEQRLAELDAIADDEQLTEAYSCYTAAQLRRMHSWLEKTADDAKRFADFKKANRKPVVRKAKPAGVQVAKLQYLKETQVPGVRGEITFTSVSPVQIVGAQQVWVYNVKNKKLGVYNATGSAGFSVKGTSLQGWDPDTSVQRTLRKPDIVIQQCLDAGKVQLRKVLSDLTTSETKLNGRINADTIIVRVL